MEFTERDLMGVRVALVLSPRARRRRRTIYAMIGDIAAGLQTAR
jgi:hypothetical protein